MIRKILRNIINWSLTYGEDREINKKYPHDIPIAGNMIGTGIRKSVQDGHKSMTLIVHYADGGKVIETIHHDQHTNQSRNKMYVITEKENLGEELEQIITREQLSR